MVKDDYVIRQRGSGGAGPLVRRPEHQELTFAASPRRLQSCKVEVEFVHLSTSVVPKVGVEAICGPWSYKTNCSFLYFVFLAIVVL